MKYFVVVVLFASCDFAKQLKGKLVAPGECTNVQAGWTCYDKDSLKRLDQTKKRGIECEQELTSCIVYNAKQDVKIQELNKEPPWYEKRWVQAVCVGLFGVGLGVGITLGVH